MSNKITDLEAFCLTHVVRPYATYIGFKHRPDSLDHSIDQLFQMLSTESDWSDLVLSRISDMRKFYFPSYINHPIVGLIRAVQSATQEGKA